MLCLVLDPLRGHLSSTGAPDVHPSAFPFGSFPSTVGGRWFGKDFLMGRATAHGRLGEASGLVPTRCAECAVPGVTHCADVEHRQLDWPIDMAAVRALLRRRPVVVGLKFTSSLALLLPLLHPTCTRSLLARCTRRLSCALSSEPARRWPTCPSGASQCAPSLPLSPLSFEPADHVRLSMRRYGVGNGFSVRPSPPPPPPRARPGDDSVALRPHADVKKFADPSLRSQYDAGNPVVPIGPGLTSQDEWWFRGPAYRALAPAARSDGAVEQLPAGGSITFEIACHVDWTSLGRTPTVPGSELDAYVLSHFSTFLRATSRRFLLPLQVPWQRRRLPRASSSHASSLERARQALTPLEPLAGR